MKKYLRPFEKFAQLESAGGILLFAATIFALIWANSPAAGLYSRFFETHITIGFGKWQLTEPFGLWINDGLMALFFFVVGLEIKRELISGELNSLKKAALPIAGAIGGMIVPVILFLSLNMEGEHAKGWAIPMATDIAFAMTIIRLFGSRIPRSVVVFLTALAIVDDIGAVLVIALFYTAQIHTVALAVAAVIIILLIIMCLKRVSSLWVYYALGIILWIAMFESGVHSTVAGVILGLVIPHRHKRENRGSPLHQAETQLSPFVNYLIMPLFALANAGIPVNMAILKDVFVHPLSLGIILGLFAGKQIGIALVSYLAIKAKIASMPRGAKWKHIYGASIIGGIGFTMSIFIADLALEHGANLELAKLSIILASLISGISGAVFILLTSKHRRDSEEAGDGGEDAPSL